MKRTNLLCLIMALSSPSCIDTFEPEGVKQPVNLLVVDGAITNDTTVVRLSRSIGLSEDDWSGADINHAGVYVECSDGSRFAPVAPAEGGAYRIPVGELKAAHTYRLHIDLDGEAYESTFLAPLFTPEIDSLSWQKAGQGEPVGITVSTHDPLDQSRYYRWTYSEDWEFKAELFAQAGIVYRFEGITYYKCYDLQSPNNTYYCWGNNRSADFITGSSEKLSANVISHKKLIEIDPSDEKLSILYYVSVTQQQVRKEAYDYYVNLQKNISQSGSIFSPIPAEMTSNIRCLTHPDRPAIGYVEVGTTVSASRFIPESTGLYEAPFAQCALLVIRGMPNDYAINGIYEFTQGQGGGPEPGMVIGKVLSSAPSKCLDCTLRGTKNKPAFWPTKHL